MWTRVNSQVLLLATAQALFHSMSRLQARAFGLDGERFAEGYE